MQTEINNLHRQLEEKEKQRQAAASSAAELLRLLKVILEKSSSLSADLSQFMSNSPSLETTPQQKGKDLYPLVYLINSKLKDIQKLNFQVMSQFGQSS